MLYNGLNVVNVITYLCSDLLVLIYNYSTQLNMNGLLRRIIMLLPCTVGPGHFILNGARSYRPQGVNVREKAKQLVTLLKDEERLREERIHALKTKEKMAQTSSGEADHYHGHGPLQHAAQHKPSTLTSSGSFSSRFYP